MTTIQHENFDALYEEYIRDAAEIESKASPLEGLFGFNPASKNHPRHEEFFQECGLMARELAEKGDREEAKAAAELILFSAADHRDTISFWYLFAAQQHLSPLIPLLSPGDAKELLDRYDNTYPRRERLPAQKAVYKELKKRAGDRA